MIELYENWKSEQNRNDIISKVDNIKKELFKIASDFFGDDELIGIYMTGSILDSAYYENDPGVDISIVIKSIRYNKGRLCDVEDEIKEYFYFDELPKLNILIYNGQYPNDENYKLLIDKWGMIN